MLTYRWADCPNVWLLTSWKMDSPWTASCIWCCCCCCSLERRCSRFADWRHIVIISVHANIFKRVIREFRKKNMHLMTPIYIYADEIGTGVWTAVRRWSSVRMLLMLRNTSERQRIVLSIESVRLNDSNELIRKALVNKWSLRENLLCCSFCRLHKAGWKAFQVYSVPVIWIWGNFASILVGRKHPK